MANFLDFRPTVAEPCLTASMAYSSWKSRPWGDQVTTSESYWLRNIFLKFIFGGSCVFRRRKRFFSCSEKKIKKRFRIDRHVHGIFSNPKIAPAVISKIEILAHIKIQLFCSKNVD